MPSYLKKLLIFSSISHLDTEVNQRWKFPELVGIMTVASVIFFGCSTVRHALFQSDAWDLGIFDQAIYLISQGKPPISSILGFHILGDHAAFVFYPLALFYKIYPDVHWLFAIQSMSLALGALPIWYLAQHRGLKAKHATVLALVYLLYPLVFNINLFDFHPEVIALPTVLGATWAAFIGEIWWFCLAIFLILSCKAVLSLTVVAMGFWLLLFEKRRLCGGIAIAAGVAWFLIATLWVIPTFGGEAATLGRHLSRYSELGNSFPEIVKNLLFKPQLALGKIFSLATLEYLGLLLFPVIWGLSPQHLAPLVGAIPALAMNILAESPAQRNLVHQYSLPILPFLLLTVISTRAAGKGWIQHQRGIILWSLVAFLALGKYGYFGSIYLDSLDTWKASREAISQIHAQGSVLTSSSIAPHLSHRPIIKLTNAGSESADLTEFEYILLNQRHPGFGSTPEVVPRLLERLNKTLEFELTYQRDDVYLFKKKLNETSD